MGLLDTIKANKVNAEKASALDALEQEHVANGRFEGIKSNWLWY